MNEMTSQPQAPAAEAARKLQHSSVIRSWEVGQGSDGGMTDDQRKPWRLTIEQDGDQVSIRLWPEGESEADATVGLGIFLEVNEGRPAVHIAPGPLAENACHVHAIGPSLLEVTASSPLYSEVRQSVVYDATRALVCSDEPLPAEGAPEAPSVSDGPGQQLAEADRAYEAYDFGEGVSVEDASGWNVSGMFNARHYSRIVCVRYASEPADRPTRRVSFGVRFDEDGKLAEAYALSMDNGEAIGRRVYATASGQ